MTDSTRRVAPDFLDSVVLDYGPHASPEQGMCVMEAVAYFAGEPHSDHPKCASRVITAFAMRLNDRWTEGRRQALKPYIPRIVGTAASDAVERRRAYACADWACRELLPMVFEGRVAKWPEAATWAMKLRALAPIVDRESSEAACETVREARDAAYAAYAAADAAAYAAAYAADAAARVKADAAALAFLDRLIGMKDES